MSANPFSHAALVRQGFLTAREASAFEQSLLVERGYVPPSSYARLRQRYVAGEIEADEFEAGLDALLARDPEALDHRRSWPSNAPGALVSYYPSTKQSFAAVDSVTRDAYRISGLEDQLFK